MDHLDRQVVLAGALTFFFFIPFGVQFGFIFENYNCFQTFQWRKGSVPPAEHQDFLPSFFIFIDRYIISPSFKTADNWNESG